MIVEATMIVVADIMVAEVVVGMVVTQIIEDHQCHTKASLNQVKVNIFAK